jgi:chromosome segregation ATPase
MGFASYFENIVERLGRDVDDIGRTLGALERDGTALRAQKRKLEAVHQALLDALGEARRMLDLLTDPSVDLVKENQQLRDEMSRRKSEVATLQSKVDELRSRAEASEAARVKVDRDGLANRCELRTLRHDHARLQDQHRRLEKEHARLKKEHARRGR